MTITPQAIYQELRVLPDESLAEIWQFLEFLRFKQRCPAIIPPPMVKLGGILRPYAVDITEKEIAQARQTMWSNLGELDA